MALTGVILGAFRVHWGNGWYFGRPDGGWEYLAVLLVGLVVVALLGPGAARLGAGRPELTRPGLTRLAPTTPPPTAGRQS
jgi:putative oxidoreductase